VAFSSLIDRSYGFARRDFENTDRYLEKGGLLLFDDSYDGSPIGCARWLKNFFETEIMSW